MADILLALAAAGAAVTTSVLASAITAKKKNNRHLYEMDCLQTEYDTYKNDKEAIINQQTDSISHLEAIAYYDSVTGLSNLNKFELDCNALFEEEPEANFAMMVMEISNINKINLLFGLEETDKVRRFIAEIFDDSLHEGYTYARIHDDLFAVLTFCDEDDDATSLTEFLTERISSYSNNFNIDLSFGIYQIKDKTMSVSNMVTLAEYAKRMVHSTLDANYAFYTKELDERLSDDKQMGEEMNYALEHHQFVMYLQPMVNLRNHQIISAEALVRWNHPTKGILSPFRFIPLFESNNFIVKLDHYIWTDAFKTIRHWIDNNVLPIPIAINISPIHFNHPGFVSKLTGLAKQFRVPTHMIQLELPERAFSETDDNIKTILNKLNSEGFQICIDNFGSYHSPINLLKDLPISEIKLDRAFLNRSLPTQDGLTIIRYLNAMAKELDTDVIAEGVETIDQANHLLEIGCDYAQGFFFAKPLPLREFDELHAKVLDSKYTPAVMYPTFSEGVSDLLP